MNYRSVKFITVDTANKKSAYTHNKIFHNTADIMLLNIHGYCINRHESNGARNPPCNGANYLVV
jgi:hypothetical protein